MRPHELLSYSTSQMETGLAHRIGKNNSEGIVGLIRK